MLLLTLTLLSTVPILAKKPPDTPGPGPPPKGETYIVTFTGPHITSSQLELMSSGPSGKGGKYLALYTPSGERSSLTFVGEFWENWAGSHEGGLRLSIDFKFKDVDMVYFFDHEYEPLNFWRLKSADEGQGDWIAYEGRVSFSDDPFEIWRYSNQGDITTLHLTFDVTVEPKP